MNRKYRLSEVRDVSSEEMRVTRVFGRVLMLFDSNEIAHYLLVLFFGNNRFDEIRVSQPLHPISFVKGNN